MTYRVSMQMLLMLVGPLAGAAFGLWLIFGVGLPARRAAEERARVEKVRTSSTGW